MLKKSNQATILTSAYLAPIQYFTKYILYDSILIEVFDNYSKQSYRNRCNIYSANGLLTLSIPVEKGASAKTLTKEIHIDYDMPWQKIHWKALESAYNHSPFYEYYIDDFRKFYYNKFDYLIDFNNEINDIVLKNLQIEKQSSYTTDFVKIKDHKFDDFRESIHPKNRCQKNDGAFVPIKYKQVFDEKFGFIPNLSIIDLLFNEGPYAITVLEGSCNTIR
jgi:hypothetical protein